MRVDSDFATGNGKNIVEFQRGRFRLEMRWDKTVYQHYCFRAVAGDAAEEASVDVYRDPAAQNVKERPVEHVRSRLAYPGATPPGWTSAEGPFASEVNAWRRFAPHLVESSDGFTRFHIPLDAGEVAYVSSHHKLAPDTWIQLLRRKEAEFPAICRYSSIGETPEGREIPCLTVGDGEKRIMMIGGMHPAESAGCWAMWGMIEFLCSTIGAARSFRERYHFEFLPVPNPDGSFRGNTCFTGNNVDPFEAFLGAGEGRFPAEEARLIWQHASGRPLSLLCDFHAYGGGIEPPGEGLLMIYPDDQAQIFSPRTARVYQLINDHVIFFTGATSTHYRPLRQLPESLAWQIGEHCDVPSIFYEFNGGLNSPYSNTRSGILLLRTVMNALAEAESIV